MHGPEGISLCCLFYILYLVYCIVNREFLDPFPYRAFAAFEIARRIISIVSTAIFTEIAMTSVRRRRSSPGGIPAVIRFPFVRGVRKGVFC